MDKKIENEMAINPSRLDYLLGLYKISNDDLARQISGKRKPLTGEELRAMVEKKKITLTLLKRIDKFFQKGLNWYATERKLPEFKSSSIFYRKERFSIDPNFESRKVTSRYEERKFEIMNLCAAINFKLERKLETYQVNSDARAVAKKMRAEFDRIEHRLYEKKILKKTKDDPGALKKYKTIIESMNVFVFEYLEHSRKKDKANFNGFFIQPNIIVIKGQKYRRREIFTLLHEFAHYLLNSEEIDEIEEGAVIAQNSRIERWCNDFVFHFLIGDQEQSLANIAQANAHNNFQREKVEAICGATSLSLTAVYTRLLIENKISQPDYDRLIREISEKINRDNFDEKLKNKQLREFLIEQGKTPQFYSRKPLPSELFKEIVRINFFEGRLDEVEVCDYLNIKMDKIGKELY